MLKRRLDGWFHRASESLEENEEIVVSGADRFAEFFTQTPVLWVVLAAVVAIIWPALANFWARRSP